MSVLSIATSGLTAASLRTDVAASNIANVRTTGPLPASGGSSTSAVVGSPGIGPMFPAAYVPLRVDQVSQSNGSTPGGTIATVSTVSPSYTAQSDPNAPFANQNGLVAAPNVDLANEFAQLAAAKYSFIANAKVIQAYAETEGALLDIKT
ncbi:flagellar biosynthesis protein FlgC [Bradyrhizobium diazoefficiens]|nr:flagellar basal body protein [Bradyrhizobium diazoefficiens]MBR0963864.1 flagellar biosynthesis protein FlgC [Bradyrhizobium diazoefficiens]MBR0978015.1 flagellar biosynthesis protein FlgC [Bradyrhizobium diazoefficiens]MBR1007524.1 flagellar biosynthesis protein FlgC [Bradyrhizobium diazoefficiens]MBR1012633.1 flagellar biosynthesis protein FlgC [Bradyrhizobium diazoefficiens]MBR1053604.1 flagellar biosynthesis protein FlgC [Bradyrhizobium diazoefficiens]